VVIGRGDEMRPKINQAKIHDLLYDEDLRQFRVRADQIDRDLKRVKMVTVYEIFSAVFSIAVLVFIVWRMC